MDIHSLEQILTENLTWNQSRIKFLPRFLIALFQVQTVSLAKIALMLAVAYKGVSIPLFWIVLDERGCWDNLERRQILEQFIDEFGAESIRLVTADREFASKDWIDDLVTKKIEFRLRIKANYQITNSRGKLIRAVKLCRTLKVGQPKEFSGKRRLWNQALYVGGLSQCGWRSCDYNFIGAKWKHLARIRRTLADRNIVRILENKRISIGRYTYYGNK